MDDTVTKILDERGDRYGNYLEQTRISNALLAVIDGHLRRQDKTLEADQADALNMIAVKIARIVNGDPDYADNWTDIAGYATLVAERLQGKSR